MRGDECEDVRTQLSQVATWTHAYGASIEQAVLVLEVRDAEIASLKQQSADARARGGSESVDGEWTRATQTQSQWLQSGGWSVRRPYWRCLRRRHRRSHNGQL